MEKLEKLALLEKQDDTKIRQDVAFSENLADVAFSENLADVADENAKLEKDAEIACPEFNNHAGVASPHIY